MRLRLRRMLCLGLGVLGTVTMLSAPPVAAADCPAPGGVAVPAASASGDVVFRGHGWGHGLGMSQYGAQGAAKLGCGYGTILSTYYRGSHLATASMPRSVFLRMLDNGGQALVTAQTGAVSWQVVDGSTVTTVRKQPKGSTWKVVRDSTATRFRLVGGTGATVWTGGLDKVLRLAHSGVVVHLVTKTWNRNRDQWVTYLDRRLRWDYTRFSYDGSWFDAVEQITNNARGTGMQKYLRGIAEVPTLFPVEALKAQAVAARTYAARLGGGTAGRPMMPTPADQNYTGYDKESEDASFGNRWRSAVDATDGEVLKDADGRYVVTYYSSSMGGYTEDVRYVGWSSTKVGYLTAVEDSRWDLASSNPSAYRSWASGFTWGQLASRLRAYGAAIGDSSIRFSEISSISVPARGSDARLQGVKVTGLRGGHLATAFVSGWDVREAMGLLSPGFTIWVRTIGGAKAQPIAGDWDGDGDTDIGWFKDGAVALSMNGKWIRRFTFGRAGDRAVVGDWDGNGRDSIGLFRDGRWLLRDTLSSGPADHSFTFGQSGDRPVVGRWTGKGPGVGVVRGGRWLLRNSPTGGQPNQQVTDGSRSWSVVAGDWNGDGKETIGVWRAAEWRLRDELAEPAGTIFTFGTKQGDRPLVGDWDGDGSTTAGIVRGQTFVLKQGNSAGAARTSVRFRG